MADYFNLTVDGLGYLSQIELKSINNQEPVWVCRLAALRGSTDKAAYTYFECQVVGKKAKQLFELLHPSSDAKQKILVSFVLSDLQANPFIFEAGKPGVYLNARLLKLRGVRIGQDEVYREQPKQVATQAELNTVVPESIPELVTD